MAALEDLGFVAMHVWAFLPIGELWAGPRQACRFAHQSVLQVSGCKRAHMFLNTANIVLACRR